MSTLVLLVLTNNLYGQHPYSYSSRPIITLPTPQEKFEQYCIDGNILRAKFVYTCFSVTISPSLFSMVSQQGHFKILRWLYEKSEKMQHNSLLIPFQNACGKGHMDIAKWLLQLDLNLSSEITWETLNHVCSESDIQTAKWLMVLQPSLREMDSFEAYNVFLGACKLNHLDTAKWIYSMFSDKIEIHKKQDYLFRTVAENNLVDMGVWLLSLDFLIPERIKKTPFTSQPLDEFIAACLSLLR
jgi:hypothetical protein